VVGHPRDSKRISMLQEVGFAVEAAAFERDYHSGRMPTCPVESLGRIAHGKYLQRIGKMLRALPILRRAMKRSDVAYASGPDMAFFALVAGLGLGRPVVVEVGDIRHLQVSPGLKGKLARFVERFVVDACGLLVVTAPGFVDGYYRGRLRCKTPVLVLENKLDERAMAGLHAAPSSDARSAPLRVGYFGVLRCEWSWKTLAALARSRPDIRVVIAGYPMEPADLPAEAAKIPNVEFRGQYRSPQDLPGLYGDVDLVWACYPSPAVTDPDWRWAQAICRSNRFYESCFFQRPIITVAGSGDGVDVERYGLGLVLEDLSTDAILQAVGKVSGEDRAQWQRNVAALPRNVYMYGAETEELRRILTDMGATRRSP
jgi:succinoglycan biosynthesis protein ExoL